jgi:crotonobetainyl-CoA:carnitine CoA-transferase CaiB-like acyl-CoA transferase
MFQNLKVLELASVLAGPSVGQFFAELGAEVIKVENLKTNGDVTRSWKGSGEETDDRSAYFCSCNWGKKSVALDLTSIEGKQIVKQLAQRADIIIASYKPGDAEKLGVSYQQLKINNQSLVYGQVTGYGSDTNRVGYDAVIQAESGFMDLNGEAEGPPIKMPVALVDVLAAHQLKEGMLLALLKRERTGEGSLVEVSLVQSALASLANQATNWLVAKKLPTRKGSAHPNIAPYGDFFVTKDRKRILLAIGSDGQFDDLIRVLSIEQKDIRYFSTNQKRVENRNALNKLLTAAVSKVSAETLCSELNRFNIPAGIIQNVEEALSTKHANAILLEQQGLKGLKNFVATVTGVNQNSNLLPPPHFGEHTEEILASLN